MDLITTALTLAVGKLSETLVADAYNALKTAIIRKFGVNHEITSAIDNLEKKPDSVGRQETLYEEISVTSAPQDSELLELSRNLIDQLKEGGARLETVAISQQAGDNSIQIGQARDVSIGASGQR